jgi:hypothetical protein
MKIYIIIAVFLIIAYYYVFIVKKGKLSFWRKAAKNPDFVYMQILQDGAWIIDDGNTQIDKERFNGPFRLYVPLIGKIVHFYGEIGKYEDSQKTIEAKMNEILNIEQSNDKK